MSQNQIQHGGNHYRTEYQHWDWCIDLKLGYLESAATKYLSRWRNKNGLEDIRKAGHYMAKAVEAHNENRYFNTSILLSEKYDTWLRAHNQTERFLEAYELTGIESDIMSSIACWVDTLEGKRIVGLITLVERCVEGGGDPRALTGWPMLATGSTLPHVAAAPAPQGMAPAPAAPQRSTNHPSPFGYQEEQEL